MFLPSVYAEPEVEVLRQIIHDNPLAILTTAIPSSTQSLILSTHVPVIFQLDENASPEKGVLRAHIARQNPQAKVMIDTLKAKAEANPEDPDANVLDQEVLVLFTSDVHHYLTPKFYTETKPTTAKVVPTWNYSAVQAYGKARVFYDSKSPESAAFLQKQIHDLSEHCEKTIMDYTGKGDRPGPWKVTDAPEKYIEIMCKAIIGIEVVIDRLEGKVKMTQEKSPGDREGVIRGFRSLGTKQTDKVADLVEERHKAKLDEKAKHS